MLKGKLFSWLSVTDHDKKYPSGIEDYLLSMIEQERCVLIKSHYMSGAQNPHETETWLFLQNVISFRREEEYWTYTAAQKRMQNVLGKKKKEKIF